MALNVLPELGFRWPMPSKPKPIVIIGAGGIVTDAHLPAYYKAGFPVLGIYDIDQVRAKKAAADFKIDQTYSSLDQACSMKGVIYDIAVPPEHLFEIVDRLPEGATALLQKPMGINVVDADRIRAACHSKNLVAAVNFQLRFSPAVLAAKDVINHGILGDIVDVDVRLNVNTPWQMFPALLNLDRVEIQVHTVHYLDLIRSILGDPIGVYARTVQHPSFTQLKSTKTSAILNYGNLVRCCLSINHNYEFGPRHEAAEISLQGTRGAALITLGVMLNYPIGERETLEIATREIPWQQAPVEGGWFPDAFAGKMANLQRFVSGEDNRLISDVDDAFKTMALVEACYCSDASGGTPITGTAKG